MSQYLNFRTFPDLSQKITTMFSTSVSEVALFSYCSAFSRSSISCKWIDNPNSFPSCSLKEEQWHFLSDLTGPLLAFNLSLPRAVGELLASRRCHPWQERPDFKSQNTASSLGRGTSDICVLWMTLLSQRTQRSSEDFWVTVFVNWSLISFEKERWLHCFPTTSPSSCFFLL